MVWTKWRNFLPLSIILQTEFTVNAKENKNKHFQKNTNEHGSENFILFHQSHGGTTLYIPQRRTIFCALFHELGFLHCSSSELISETFNPFRYICRSPWTGDQPISRLVPTYDDTIQKNAVIFLFLERGINPRFQCSSGTRHTHLKPQGYRERLYHTTIYRVLHSRRSFSFIPVAQMCECIWSQGVKIHGTFLLLTVTRLFWLLTTMTMNETTFPWCQYSCIQQIT
jgi:hypothetical protein